MFSPHICTTLMTVIILPPSLARHLAASVTQNVDYVEFSRCVRLFGLKDIDVDSEFLDPFTGLAFAIPNRKLLKN